MQAINTTFQQIISGPKQFLIPVFQRDYKWQEDNWQKLWEDIRGASGAGHFAGSIVHASNTAFAAIPTYLVIDGQQRLSTLTVLCAALRDHIRDTGLPGNGAGPTSEEIDAHCLKNTFASGDYRYKLVLRRTDNEVLRSVVDGRLQDNGARAELSLIDEAYWHFRERLNEEGIDPAAIYRGVMGLRIVEMALDPNIDNPQSVFESMNSTGVDLSQSDLVRNYLLMGLAEAEQTRLYEQYWQKIESLFRAHDSAFDSFIRDYIALRRGDIKQARADRIYEEFKRFLIDASETLELEDQLREMLRFADYYAKIRGFNRDASEKVSQALANVRHHGDTTSLLIMRLLDCRDAGSLTQDGFVTSLEAIEGYLMRRAVTRAQTRAYWGNFAGLAKQVYDSAPLNSLLFALRQLHGASAFPNDSDFRRTLEEGDLYRTRVCWQLLSRLENHGTREPSPTTSYSIEHIMPQNENLSRQWQDMLGENWREIHESWLHRLGNLTLTAYNSQYSDRPFEEKKTIAGGFNESAVRLNAYVKQQEKWTADEMADRGRRLTDRALEIWRYPQPSQEYVAARHDRRVQEQAEKTDVTRVPMTRRARDLFNQIHSEIMNFGDGIQAAHEHKSVCYYTAESDFFLELLPRKNSLMLLLDVDSSEIDAPGWLVKDANDWKFIPNSTGQHDYGVVVDMREPNWGASVLAIIHQSYNLASD